MNTLSLRGTQQVEVPGGMQGASPPAQRGNLCFTLSKRAGLQELHTTYGAKSTAHDIWCRGHLQQDKFLFAINMRVAELRRQHRRDDVHLCGGKRQRFEPGMWLQSCTGR